MTESRTARFPRPLPLAAGIVASLACVAFVVGGDEKDGPGAAPREKPAGAAQKSPPAPRKLTAAAGTERVALPLFGEYLAKDFVSLIEALWGKPVEFTSVQVEQTPLRIDKAISEQYVGSDELTLLLAAHRLYLVPHVRNDGTEVMIVTRDPHWRPEPPRFRKVLEVAPGHFRPVWRAVENAVKTANAKLPRGEQPIVAVPAKSLGKIFLGAGTRKQIDGLELVARDTQRAVNPDRPRFYTYVGRARRAQELLDIVENALTKGERKKLRIVVAHRGNRLLFRAPAAVGEKVQAVLKKHDRKRLRLPADLSGNGR